MDDDELLPEDDSVFEELVDDPFNSSDALLEDSFSSLPDMSSTPFVVRRQRGSSPPAPAPSSSGVGEAPSSPGPSNASSRASRARAAAPNPPRSPPLNNTTARNPDLDSPSRSTRSRTRAATPVPSCDLDSPSRSTRSRTRAATPVPSCDLDSPSRSTRSRTRAATPVPNPDLDSPSRSTRSRGRAVSPAPATASVSGSPSRRAAPRNAAVSGSSGPERISSTVKEIVSRIKCRECPSTLANERTFKIHKQMHAMKRAFSRAAKLEKLQEDFNNLATKTLDKLLEEKFVGKWATPLKDYTQKIKDTFNAFEEEHQELNNFLCGELYKILSDHSSVFSSSLVHSFYMGVNKLLNNSEFVDNLQKRIVALGEVQPPEMPLLNLFVGNFMHLLSSEIVMYFIRTIHRASNNDVVRRKRSKDKIDSIEFLEMSYYIGGSVVRTFFVKGNKYKETNPAWKLFTYVLLEKFVRVVGVGNACATEVSHFTEKVDRGKLTHISQEALDFFVVLFDFLMSLEGEDGSLPENVIADNVLQNDTIICLWDVLAGSDLDDEMSLDFLMQMSETCKRIVIKGIMKRRLNENIRKAVSSVPLRSRLAE